MGQQGMKKIGVAIVLVLLLSGYSKTTPVPPTQEPTVAMTPVTVPSPTATALPTSLPPSPSPTPATPAASCPPRRELPFPARPTTVTEAPAVLAAYLSAGGDPAQLVPLLHEWEMLPPQSMNPVEADLTGDGVPELALSIIDPAAQTYPPEGTLLVYTCQAGNMDLLQAYTPGQGLGIYPVGAEDFTGDGIPELAYATELCGAHTCFRAFYLWTWRATAFAERVAPGTLSLPYPTFLLAPGTVRAVSGGIGSVGAGPQRTITQTWTWNGTTLTQTATEVAPAVFRYHAFLDAETPFFAGNYAAALPLYERVLTDETLQPWAPAISAADERAGLQALAHWRRLLSRLQLGDRSGAQAEYETLQTTFVDHPVARLAQRFWEGSQGGGSVKAGCGAALAAPESLTVVEFLNQFGYANPTYEVHQLCPFTTP